MAWQAQELLLSASVFLNNVNKYHKIWAAFTINGERQAYLKVYLPILAICQEK